MNHMKPICSVHSMKIIGGFTWQNKGKNILALGSPGDKLNSSENYLEKKSKLSERESSVLTWTCSRRGWVLWGRASVGPCSPPAPSCRSAAPTRSPTGTWRSCRHPCSLQMRNRIFCCSLRDQENTNTGWHSDRGGTLSRPNLFLQLPDQPKPPKTPPDSWTFACLFIDIDSVTNALFRPVAGIQL